MSEENIRIKLLSLKSPVSQKLSDKEISYDYMANHIFFVSKKDSLLVEEGLKEDVFGGKLKSAYLSLGLIASLPLFHGHKVIWNYSGESKFIHFDDLAKEEIKLFIDSREKCVLELYRVITN